MIVPINIEFSIKEEKWVSNTELTIERCITSMCIALKTNDFQINIEDGKASVRLNRPLTPNQALQLGNELIRVAKEAEEMQRQPIEQEVVDP